MADRSPGLCEVLKSEWGVEAASHHITLGIGAGAGLVGRVSETEKDEAGDPDPQTCEIMEIMDFWARQDLDGFS